jgi:HEAT repeat protein
MFAWSPTSARYLPWLIATVLFVRLALTNDAIAAQDEDSPPVSERAAVVAEDRSAAELDPYQRQAVERMANLKADDDADRQRAAEALGYLRYAPAAPALQLALTDPASAVRREAALALAWCGGRAALPPLCTALQDQDWSVRQAAWVALTNLTGMDFAFDALADRRMRNQQSAVWRQWVSELPAESVPPDVLALLGDLPKDPPTNDAAGRPVEVSSCYIGGGVLGQTSDPASITDGSLKTLWMTKDVDFPQSCTIDLGEGVQVGRVIIHQHPPFAMTEYSIELAVEPDEFIQVAHRAQAPSTTQTVSFEPRPARYLRINSLASRNPTYPTALLQVETRRQAAPAGSEQRDHQIERALRSLGTLGGADAVEHVIRAIRPWLDLASTDETRFSAKRRVQAGIRALGLLGGDHALEALVTMLHNEQWARYAADALGDLGGEDAAAALLAAYPDYARGLNRPANPRRIHSSDTGQFDPRDRIPAATYAITMSLSRIDFQRRESIEALRDIATLLVANIPSDADAMMVYDKEPHQQIVAWLLDRVGLRQAVVDAAFEALGQDRRVLEIPQRETLLQLARGQLDTEFPTNADQPPYAGNFLAALCHDPADVPLLLNLLDHPNHWVRINAVKALIFMDAREAVPVIAERLSASPPEADYGFFAERLHDTWQVGQDEFNDPAPRFREAYLMALGRLGAADHVPLLTEILQDERNVLESRYAAAVALDQLGTPDAVEALRQAEAKHDFHSVRMVAREAIWKRDLPPQIEPRAAIDADSERLGIPKTPIGQPTEIMVPEVPTRFVFLQGDHNPHNTFRTDNWRQTHNTTDAGPVYRPGRNLAILDINGPSPVVVPLTEFSDGYVADAHVSYDGRRVLFARRLQHDPWWHLYEINVDGSHLRQITHGPYHHVSPAYLPDGRIVFSTTRLGTRDEYHGYPCTGLAVMDLDGSNLQFIGFNLGRDADTVIGPDGNLLFARLEIFYARLKVEWNLLSALPDGTQTTTRYGPERREFWSQIDGGYTAWGDTGLRHRVLRLSQPQPFGPARYVMNTQAGPIVTEGRRAERIIRPDMTWAITSPYPLDDRTLLVAAGKKPYESVGGSRPTDTVDLGIYQLDMASGDMTPLYNDPHVADFGARPLHPRPIPPVIATSSGVRQRQFTGTLYCSSAFISQLDAVGERGRLVRIIEGLPQVARHQTHTNHGLPWKNHGGAIGRVLGTVPLAADGSFAIEVPADRFLHLQVLDSDRQVVGNQLLWMYVRPGERKGCIGCHESPDTTTASHQPLPLALSRHPARVLPTGDSQFRYRAKAWFKGHLPDEREERQRTVQSITLFGRP